MIAFRRAEKISPGKVLRNPFARDLIGELLARRSQRDAVGRRLRDQLTAHLEAVR